MFAVQIELDATSSVRHAASSGGGKNCRVCGRFGILRHTRRRQKTANSMTLKRGWESILGLQFENLIVNNFRELVRPLHLEGVPVLSAVPYEKRPGKAGKRGEGKGVQIDLLVQTRKSLYVVEVKRKSRIDESIETEVAEKVARLRHPRGMSVRTALVYEGELAPVIRGNGYFDAIISAADLISA